jgi:ATP-dependent Lon protease
MSKNKELPVLPIRDPEIIIFPGQLSEIDVARSFSLNAIASAREEFGDRIIVAMQKNCDVSIPNEENFHSICVEAEIKENTMMSSNENKRCRLIVLGLSRCNLVGVSLKNGSHYVGTIEKIVEPDFILSDELRAQLEEARRIIKKNFSASVSLKNPNVPQTSVELSEMVDDVASQLNLKQKEKIDLLKQKDPRKRLEKLYKYMSELILQRSTNNNSCKNHSEDEDGVKGEIERLEEILKGANLPPDALKIAEQEIRRLKMMSPSSSEFQVTLNYVDNLVGLPWDKSSDDSLDLDFAKKCLDEDHYGLEKVKERILEFLAVRKLAPNQKGSILCLAGSPGTGKTSCAKSIARAMNKEYVRISLGGLHDEAEIRGHRKTYIGAMPGRVIQSLKKVGVNNPVFVLDEIDKLSKDYRGDPSSALLEVLDPEQNNTFQDNYINTPFDLSKVFFITTANDLGTIPQALRDRLEIIEIPGYSPFDKIRIAQNYLIPKQKNENGVGDLEISVSENAISKIIEEYTSEAGVRRLEKYCGTIMRKIAVQVASNKKPQTNISVNLIPKFLGPPKVFADKANEQPLVGVSTGMAWSQNGGSILFVETMFTPGNGNIKVTGSVGKVLEESANAAFTWIRSHAAEYGVDLTKVASHDIHIHLPAGATPKDGPSAGIAITSAMLSTIVDLPVANDVAMTGEISLRGRVLPIGGLKEKVLAAHRAGIKKIIFPKDNSFDLEEIPKDVLAELEMIPVSELSEAIPILIASIEHPKKYCGTEPVCSLEN